MKDTAYLVIGNDIDLQHYPFKEDSLIVGVDRGALALAQAHCRIDLAYGDFDSVSKEELDLIRHSSSSITFLNPVKDVSDTEGILEKTEDYRHIVLLGAIQGKRPEHFLSNLKFFNKLDNLIMEDDHTIITKLLSSASPYVFKHDSHRFYSFFPLGRSIITLEGFDYPLKDKKIDKDTSPSLLVSNEIRKEGKVILKGDPVLLFRSKDDERWKL